MPKSIKLINDFSGGLVNAMHSRDIPEGALSVADNIQVTKDGSIEPLASVSEVITADSAATTYNLTPFNKGNSFYHFKSDYSIGASIMIVNSKEEPDSITDTVRFYTNIEHGLKIGLVVTLSGVHESFLGHHTITNIKDPFSFDIASTDHGDVHPLVFGDITVDAASDLSVALANNIADDIVVDDGDASNYALWSVGNLLRIDDELMLVVEVIRSDYSVRVIRAWPDGATGLASHSVGANILSHSWPELQAGTLGNYGGFVHYQEIVSRDNAQNNLYIIMDGHWINLTDGNITLRKLNTLADSWGSHSARTHQNMVYTKGNYVVKQKEYKNIYPIGETNTAFVNTSDGILISALPNGDDFNATYEEHVSHKILKYYPASLYTNSFVHMLTNHGNYSQANWDYDTFTDNGDNGFQAIANTSKVCRAYSYGSSSFPLHDNDSVQVSFTLSYGGNDPNLQNQIKNSPVLYWAHANNADAGVICKSSQVKAKLGKNNFFWRSNSPSDINTGRANTIKLDSNGDNVYLIWETYSACDYIIEDLHVKDGTHTGVQHGWYCWNNVHTALAADCEVAASATASATPDDFRHIGINFYPDTSVEGDWLFLNGDHSYIQFAYTKLYGQSEAEVAYTAAEKILVYTSGGANVTDSMNVGCKGLIEIKTTNLAEGNLLNISTDPALVGYRIYIHAWSEVCTGTLDTGVSPDTCTEINALDDPLHFATIYLDQDKPSTLFDGTILNFAVANTTELQATFSGIKDAPANGFYTSMTDYKPRETSTPTTSGTPSTATMAGDIKKSAICFSAACNVMGVTYIGNVRSWDSSSGANIFYPDRMYRCSGGQPQKPTLFVENNIIDVISDDGDEIVALRAFEDKLFQFKRNVVYVLGLNDADEEYIIKTLKGIGIQSPSASSETALGLAWVNSSGCYLYDGEELTNLMRGQIERGTWRSNFENFANIGYSDVDQSIVCLGKDYIYIYSFADENWVRSDSLCDIYEYQISNMVSIPGQGIAFLKSRSPVVEDITVEVTTAGVPGRYSRGWIESSGGYIVDGTTSATNLEVYIDKVGTTTNQQCTYSLNDTNETQYGHPLGYITTQINQITVNDARHIVDASIDFGSSTSDGIATMHVQSKGFGTVFNSERSGASGFHLASNSTTPGTPGWGNLTGVTVQALTGGVTPTAPVRTIVIDRKSEVKSGITYTVDIDVSRQYTYTGYTSVNSTTPTNVEQDLSGWMHYNPTHSFSYTTSYGDDNDAIRDGLAAVMNSDNVFSGRFTINTDTSSKIVLTGKACGYDQSSPIYTHYGAGGVGYYWPLGPDTGSLTSGIRCTINGQITSLDGEMSILSWRPLSFPDAQPYISFATRDIFSTSVGQRKKVYKVYITYKSTGDSNVTVKFFVDGKDISDTNAKSFTGVSNYTDSSLIDSSGEWVRAELKPTTSSDAKNLHSFRLLFKSNQGICPSDFSVNDISVVYRAKNVK